MDAMINDAPPSSIPQLEVIEERSSSSYALDIDALNRLIEFGREHNPRLRGASEARIADLCEISETTLKSIRKGRNRKPRIDILYSIVVLFGGSIDRLVGLAPTRDINREAAVWDGTLVDGLQQRVAHMTQQKAEDAAELARLRRMVLEAEKTAARAEERSRSLQHDNDELTAAAARHRQELRRHRWAMLTVAILLIALCSYLIWEMANPDAGNLRLR